MELRKAKAVGMFDDHHGRVGNIDADFDHSRGDQKIEFALLKFTHRVFFFSGIEASVQQADVKAGKDAIAKLAKHLLRSLKFTLFVFFDYWIDDICLMSGSKLLANEFPDLRRAFIFNGTRNNRG